MKNFINNVQLIMVLAWTSLIFMFGVGTGAVLQKNEDMLNKDEQSVTEN
jgi:hypothetical protein